METFTPAFSARCKICINNPALLTVEYEDMGSIPIPNGSLLIG